MSGGAIEADGKSASEDMRRVPLKSGIVWSVRILLAAAVLIAGALLLPLNYVLRLVLICILAAAALFFGGFYFPRRAKNTRYRVTNRQIHIVTGVLLRQRRSLELMHVQSIVLFHTPLQALCRLETVFFYLPGRMFVLDAVERGTADAIVERVLRRQEGGGADA